MMMENKKISDLTVAEFKELIAESIRELIDDDYGLDVRPQVIKEIEQASKEIQEGNFLNLEEVEKKYNIKLSV